MTKNQRNMLELALVHIALDPILQGDSWGLIDESNGQKVFDDIGKEIRSYSAMSDDDLLKHASTIANDDNFTEGEVLKVPAFESYDEMREWIEANVDAGDLQYQTTLDVLVQQIKNVVCNLLEHGRADGTVASEIAVREIEREGKI